MSVIIDALNRPWLPYLSVDCVIFGFKDNRLNVLLLTFKNSKVQCLSGGFVKPEEDVDTAAKRILFNRTGLKDIYLEQFYTFGNLKRNQTAQAEHQQVNADMGRSKEHYEWLSDRYITIGYFALVDIEKVNVSPDEISSEANWVDVEKIPNLFLDHNEIVEKALERLRESLDTRLLAFNLLPETFTMAELQRVYEVILGKELVRTNFQRKILSMDILDRIEKKYTGGAHKAPYVYKLKSEPVSQ
ncbi:NUDIX domain-containing protein [Sandaracinomonas limnophila]|uniref:NUDIX domain-containing protein n=1 Tax=Sandaracinomonas limnophila TaxID=1862386 RepID=A0A437PRR7_9BACT|nr:NUDIX domain-containing protein [Sandaracinomonas limnophila]RVU24953.1 NUDIX domain-containing protein [Sandaracinomonas limnophila]